MTQTRPPSVHPSSAYKTSRRRSPLLAPLSSPRLYSQIDTRPFLPLAAMNPSESLATLTQKLQALGLNKVPAEPNTYPALNPFDLYRSHVTELLAKSTGIDAKIIYPTLQRTVKTEHGDLQMAAAALRQKRKDMKEFAKEIAEKFPESPLIEKVVVMDALLMFWFKPEALTSLVVPAVLKAGSSYGFNDSNGLRDPADPSKGRKKMIVEFSSPNIAKPFHAGHLRSTIIGGFLANLYDAAGWDVTRMNYLGDWGKQYGVLAIGFDLYGSEEELIKNPIGHLYDVYVKISATAREEDEKMKEIKAKIEEAKKEGQDTSALEKEVQEIADNGVDEKARRYFKRMTEGETVALGIWKRFRDLSIEKYKKTYARLNIRYDDYSGESQVKDESMDHAAKVMEEKKVSENSEGAIIVDLTKYSKKLGKAVVRKKDGTSLYLTRDIAAVSERYEKYKFDKMIYVVASQQDLHLAQLFKILEAMDYKELAAACTHVNFGMVLGMSTRKGTAKFLDDILETVAEKMHEVMKGNQAKYEQVSILYPCQYQDGHLYVVIHRLTLIVGRRAREGRRRPRHLRCHGPGHEGQAHQQLHLRHGPHDQLRGRHRPLPPIRTRPSLQHHPQGHRRPPRRRRSRSRHRRGPHSHQGAPGHRSRPPVGCLARYLHRDVEEPGTDYCADLSVSFVHVSVNTMLM